jgi:ketosteroid isomerase-like protein
MTTVVTRQAAEEFAQEWVEAFNSHDLDRIMTHYAPEVTLTSPFAAGRGHRDGTVTAQAALRAYLAAGLADNPELRFDLLTVFAGVASVVVHYRATFGPGRSADSAEVMELDAGGLVTRVVAHYDRLPEPIRPEVAAAESHVQEAR